MSYEEFTVKAFRHLSGHLDGIYRSTSGHWFVVDYKTSSVKTIEMQKHTKTLPYNHNVSQIVAYCSLIELEWDIKISGWLLHYLARDSPATSHVTVGGLVSTKSKMLELEKMRVWDEHYNIVTHLNSLNHLKVLVKEKPCKTLKFYEKEYHSFTPCPLSCGGVCFNKERLNELLELTWEETTPLKQYRLSTPSN